MSIHDAIALGDRRFIVSTYEGFQQACKIVGEEVCFSVFEGGPRLYPSVIAFRFDRDGNWSMDITCQTLEAYQSVLKEQTLLLERVLSGD